MLRLSSWLLVALVLGGLAFVGMTATQLPPIVATHFGAGGVADGWMSRDGYTIFAMLLTLLLPLVVFASVGWLPYRFERFVNLPHRDVWLAPRIVRRRWPGCGASASGWRWASCGCAPSRQRA